MESKQEPIAGLDVIESELQEGGGDLDRLASHTIEEVVVGPEAVPDPGGPPPTGGRASARGHQDADDHIGHPPGQAAMQRCGQGGDPSRPLGGQADGEHPRPSSV